MGWSDFEILQFFFVENSKQDMNFNTGCAKNMTFQKFGSNFGIFKQALENRPNEFHRVCGAKDVTTKLLFYFIYLLFILS